MTKLLSILLSVVLMSQTATADTPPAAPKIVIKPNSTGFYVMVEILGNCSSNSSSSSRKVEDPPPVTDCYIKYTDNGDVPTCKDYQVLEYKEPFAKWNNDVNISAVVCKQDGPTRVASAVATNLTAGIDAAVPKVHVIGNATTTATITFSAGNTAQVSKAKGFKIVASFTGAGLSCNGTGVELDKPLPINTSTNIQAKACADHLMGSDLVGQDVAVKSVEPQITTARAFDGKEALAFQKFSGTMRYAFDSKLNCSNTSGSLYDPAHPYQIEEGKEVYAIHCEAHKLPSSVRNQTFTVTAAVPRIDSTLSENTGRVTIIQDDNSDAEDFKIVFTLEDGITPSCDQLISPGASIYDPAHPPFLLSDSNVSAIACGKHLSPSAVVKGSILLKASAPQLDTDIEFQGQQYLAFHLPPNYLNGSNGTNGTIRYTFNPDIIPSCSNTTTSLEYKPHTELIEESKMVTAVHCVPTKKDNKTSTLMSNVVQQIFTVTAAAPEIAAAEDSGAVSITQQQNAEATGFRIVYTTDGSMPNCNSSSTNSSNSTNSSGSSSSSTYDPSHPPVIQAECTMKAIACGKYLLPSAVVVQTMNLPSSPESDSSSKTPWVMLACVVGGVVVLALGVGMVWRRKKMRMRAQQQPLLLNDNEGEDTNWPQASGASIIPANQSGSYARMG